MAIHCFTISISFYRAQHNDGIYIFCISDNVAPDIDGFTGEPVVQCDVQVVKFFVDYSKHMIN